MDAACVTISVSDSTGNLWFDSQGTVVYNRNNAIMPNGNGLYGASGSWSQSIIGIQKIDDDSAYFLITCANSSHPSCYSVLDMRLDEGNGDIDPTQKNIPIPGSQDALFTITGTRHKNNHDVWVVTRFAVNSNNFFASYLITAAGIDTIPVLSATLVAPPIPPLYLLHAHEIKISPDGTKLVCVYYPDTVEFCDFNPATGEVDSRFKFNPIYQGGNIPTHQVEFSIDSKILYLGGQVPSGATAIFQYDATSADSSSFVQSIQEVGYINVLGQHTGLQMGPDGKIYGTRDINDSLWVINFPSVWGIGCGFQRNGFCLQNPSHADGLPQFVQRYKAYFHHTEQCQGDSIHFISDIWPQADSIHWDFGDPTSGSANFSNLPNPSHIYSNPGSYMVELFSRHIDHRTDTTWQVIIILANPQPNIGSDRIICNDDSTTFDAGACAGCTFLWKDIGSGLTVGTSQTFKTGLAGSYSVTVTNSSGCIGSDTVQLFTTPVPSVTNNPLSKSICTGESTNIPLTSNVPGTTFHWTASLISGTITGFSADSGLVINQVLTNSLSTPGVVTYHITPKVGSCSGALVDFPVTVNPGDSVKVDITASANNICTGTPVTFMAIPTNPGASPVYQWKVNGINSGTNSTTFIYTPLNGDVITCVLTSSLTVCISNNPATSNGITMVVNPNLPVSVTVATSANNTCAGTCIDLTATAINGGTSPIYQWFVNGNNVYLSNSNLTNGLVTYYPFNGNANDESGNGNNGIVNGATLTTDRFNYPNKAYYFVGNDLNNIAISPFTPPQIISISIWFNPITNGPSGNQRSVLFSNQQMYVNHDAINVVMEDGKIHFGIINTAGVEFTLLSNSPINLNQWHHVVCIIDNDKNMKIFLDNVAQNQTISWSGAYSGQNVTNIGNCYLDNDNFDGSLDDVRIYNHALNDCEITQLYLEGTSSFSINPNNGDVVTCTVNSNATCAVNNPSTSAPVTMTVNPNLPVSVSIISSSNPFCAGSSVTFTATPTNGGTTPVYQWKVNGISVGSNNPVYSYSPNNGDIVSCVLNSNISCPIGNPATSNSITMIVNSILPAGISIAASSNPFCPGSSVTFTATPSNGGSTPSYQWKVNGANVGTNSSTYSYSPTNNDSVRCVMTSNLSCVTGNPVSSAKIFMNGTLAPIVTFTSCFDTITTINAKPIKLKGGIPLGGVYSGPGVNSLTGVFTPAIAGIGTHTITYTYTNAAMCSATKSISILNLPSSILSCGNPLTDVRDNKVYQTVQIGSQCWLATNLNYGAILASSQDQRDNCLAEKYCYNDNPVNCTNHGGLYQWDELMQFDETPADQGFCPPGWHIPTENEWDILFTNYINSGFAGSPLKYSGYSGFNALLSGARHINKGWDFQGFATFFWSSTSRGSTKAWAHGMNDADPSVSSYPSSRVNAFSVRCLKD